MWNPTQSIKSRYATTTISSNFYSTLTCSGGTSISGTTLLGYKGSGASSGYIYTPYIIQESIPIIIDRETLRKELRAKRKEKLNKLGWC